MNVIRLVFIWEAYEPRPGCYDEAYLASMRAIAAAARERGVYVIVDFHQDGYSRFVSRGSGDGFPLWAVSPRARVWEPDNGPSCKRWPILMMTDPGMHRCFADFYADLAGVRTRYLVMMNRVASAFAAEPAVIGYDVINEPWGDEQRELLPLYCDAASVIRAAHPSAILFLEGHISTNCGLQTRLARPPIANVAYAPHYYDPATVLRNRWKGSSSPVDRAFARMTAKAGEWDAPLFLGEFGAPAGVVDVGDYMGCVYDRLDDHFASGAQWNYTPCWNERDKDGWNAEDFNTLHPHGHCRENYDVRPYPRAIAGVPGRFLFREAPEPAGACWLLLEWDHRPERGATELFIPAAMLSTSPALILEGEGASCLWDESRQVLLCRSPRPGPIRLRISPRQ
jgi:endoglycosylceramidase